MTKRANRKNQPLLHGLPSDLAGPPRDQLVTDALRIALTEVDPETNNTRLTLLVENWLNSASTGSFSHLRELLVRIEGKPGAWVETGPNPMILRMQALLNRHVTTPAHRAPKRPPKGGREV